MWSQPENDQFADELFLAGEKVPAGTYKQIGSRSTIFLQQEDYLPATLDGRVACYMRVNDTWEQRQCRPPLFEKDVNAAQAILTAIAA
jgi:hypothetical protein